MLGEVKSLQANGNNYEVYLNKKIGDQANGSVIYFFTLGL